MYSIKQWQISSKNSVATSNHLDIHKISRHYLCQTKFKYSFGSLFFYMTSSFNPFISKVPMYHFYSNTNILIYTSVKFLYCV